MTVSPLKSSSGRIEALDALRGLAALCVFCTHAYGIWPWRGDGDWLNNFPLLVLTNHTAPIVFYTLSGYVMALPFFREGAAPGWQAFVIKRLCRLYIPLAAATLIAALIYFSTQTIPVFFLWHLLNAPPELSWGPVPPFLTGFNQTSVEFVKPFLDPHINHLLMLGTPYYGFSADWGWDAIGRQLMLTGTTSSMILNTPAWTLVHEIRISLIFPFLVLLCRKTPRALLLSVLLFIGASLAIIASGQSNMWLCESNNFAVTWLITLRFIPFFVAGILLVKHRTVIGAWIAKLPPLGIGGLWLLIAIIFCLPTYHPLDLAFGAASSLAIVLCAESRGTQKFLMMTPLPYFGRVAYSFYLIHLPVFFAVMQMLAGKLPHMVLYALVALISLGLALILYWLVEMPSSRLGRRLAHGIAGKGQG